MTAQTYTDQYGDPIREWASEGFTLTLWDTGRSDSYGKSELAYMLTHDGHTVFTGEDFHPSPLHAIDSDEAVAGILGFLSLRPGDTDSDYFDRYTPEQLAFANAHGEHLAMLAGDLEAGTDA